MKFASALCATVIGTALFSGGSAVADVRCLPGQAAAGYCAPLHFVDDDDIRRRAYQRGYDDGLRRHGYGRGDAVPMPPDVALDSKEGYSQGPEFHRHYHDRDNDGKYERRGYYDDDLYDRRRSNDAIDFATEILRRSLRN